MTTAEILQRAEAEYTKALRLHTLRAALYELLADASVRDWHVEQGTNNVIAHLFTDDGRRYKLTLTETGLGV